MKRFVFIALCLLTLPVRAEVITAEALARTNYIAAEVGVFNINLNRQMETNIAMMKSLKNEALQKFPASARAEEEKKYDQKVSDAEKQRDALNKAMASADYRRDLGEALAQVQTRTLTHAEIEFLTGLFEKAQMDDLLESAKTSRTTPDLRLLIIRATKDDYSATAEDPLYKSSMRKLNSESYRQEVDVAVNRAVRKYVSASKTSPQ